MQSFAYKVKSELCRQPVSRQCCARAEAYGVLLFCNTFTAAEVRIITENPEFAARLPRLFQRAFSLKFDSLPDGTRDKLIFRITQRHKLARIVDLLGYDPSLVLHVNFGLLEDDCCRTAFMRGAFLAGGSVTDPEKRYHLELATSHTQASREVSALLTEMGFLPHSVRRSGSSVIYFKQSEHIEDLLTTIGAPVAGEQRAAGPNAGEAASGGPAAAGKPRNVIAAISGAQRPAGEQILHESSYAQTDGGSEGIP